MPDQLWQLVFWGLPIIGSIIALFVSFGRRRSDNAADREALITKMANQAIDAAEEARKSRNAADEAKTAAAAASKEATGLRNEITDLRKSSDAKDAQIKALEDQVKQLETQLATLNTAMNERGLEMKEKDSIIAAQVAEIARLNEERVRYAAAALPLGKPPEVTIANTPEQPVPTTDIPNTA